MTRLTNQQNIQLTALTEANSFTASQDIPRIFSQRNVHYPLHNSSSLSCARLIQPTLITLFLPCMCRSFTFPFQPSLCNLSSAPFMLPAQPISPSLEQHSSILCFAQSTGGGLLFVLQTLQYVQKLFIYQCTVWSIKNCRYVCLCLSVRPSVYYLPT